ncbi:MAG: PaaI family thioesterase [Pseudomonadota bacterium]
MERQPVLTAEEVQAFIDEVFPQQKGILHADAIGPMTATARMNIGYEHLRPGGTVSGPAMFTVADCAFYMAVLGMIGRQALTVTTNMSINFLRKPASGADLVCEARILKLGKLLATGDATVRSEGQDAPVAHATVTYAIPPKPA